MWFASLRVTFLHTILFALVVLASASLARPESSEVRRFVAENRVSKNQIVFALETRTEKVTGLSYEPQWVVQFDPRDIASSLRGEMAVAVKSLDTGKQEHNQKLQGPDWLDAARHPEIRFELRRIKQVEAKAEGDWIVHCEGVAVVRGKDYVTNLKIRLTHLTESDETRKRAPGHFVVLRGSFELPQDVFGAVGDPDRTITLELRFFGSTESSSGKPGPPSPKPRSPGKESTS